MEFIEYPKALYKQGVYIAVADAAEEDAARADGYADWADDYAAYGIPEEPKAAGEVQADPEPEAAEPKKPRKAK